ncbi:hypothetical protein K439DRAFT_1631320 [Ramaria rubella]|nr:hypothetical protein K439DRAFT_1631320 [Ramaria rubella]
MIFVHPLSIDFSTSVHLGLHAPRLSPPFPTVCTPLPYLSWDECPYVYLPAVWLLLLLSFLNLKLE